MAVGVDGSCPPTWKKIEGDYRDILEPICVNYVYDNENFINERNVHWKIVIPVKNTPVTYFGAWTRSCNDLFNAWIDKPRMPGYDEYKSGVSLKPINPTSLHLQLWCRGKFFLKTYKISQKQNIWVDFVPKYRTFINIYYIR